MSFTRGPWTATETNGGNVNIWKGTHSGAVDICKIEGGAVHEEFKANSTLIAAAPDMYAALVEVRKLIGVIEGKGTTQTFEAAGIIENVLRKARGES